MTRREWEEVAVSSNSTFLIIEVFCSDIKGHKERIEKRETTVSRLKLPTWEEVQNRDYHEWESDRLIVDTARKTMQESIDETLSKIRAWSENA